jgi:hypothetical protein
MSGDGHVVQRWTRWHSDGWKLTVVETDKGEFFYNTLQGEGEAVMKPAASKTDAQHSAEDVVRHSGHRCVARCSFWVPDTPEDLG